MQASEYRAALKERNLKLVIRANSCIPDALNDLLNRYEEADQSPSKDFFECIYGPKTDAERLAEDVAEIEKQIDRMLMEHIIKDISRSEMVAGLNLVAMLSDAGFYGAIKTEWGTEWTVYKIIDLWNTARENEYIYRNANVEI